MSMLIYPDRGASANPPRGGLGNHIKIIKGRGEKPDYLDHAKTLWLAGDERQIQTNLQPFGWLLLQPFEDITQLPPWQEAAGNPVITAWRADVSERQVRKSKTSGGRVGR